MRQQRYWLVEYKADTGEWKAVAGGFGKCALVYFDPERAEVFVESEAFVMDGAHSLKPQYRVKELVYRVP